MAMPTPMLPSAAPTPAPTLTPSAIPTPTFIASRESLPRVVIEMFLVLRALAENRLHAPLAEQGGDVIVPEAGAGG